MGLFGRRYVFIKKLNQFGQSTVEYILLFAVVGALISFVFKSQQFQDLFGDNGRFNTVFKRKLEFSYRHGLEGEKPFQTPNYSIGAHDSYNGRFFGAKDAYPQN